VQEATAPTVARWRDVPGTCTIPSEDLAVNEVLCPAPVLFYLHLARHNLARWASLEFLENRLILEPDGEPRSNRPEVLWPGRYSAISCLTCEERFAGESCVLHREEKGGRTSWENVGFALRYVLLSGHASSLCTLFRRSSTLAERSNARGSPHGSLPVPFLPHARHSLLTNPGPMGSTVLCSLTLSCTFSQA